MFRAYWCILHAVRSKLHMILLAVTTASRSVIHALENVDIFSCNSSTPNKHTNELAN
jgi:hypothetical protein